jgi:homoprotocatechuate degradation regulator HpaR
MARLIGAHPARVQRVGRADTACIRGGCGHCYHMEANADSVRPIPLDIPPGEIPSGKEYYERSLTVALLRAREVTMRRFKGFADAYELTLPQWRVMRALADGEPLDASTLCQRCVILPPSLTRILRSLCERGLIVSVPSSDARRHMVTLTPKGQALFDSLVIQSEGTRREIEEAFGVERMHLLLDLLNDLRVVTEALPEPTIPPRS